MNVQKQKIVNWSEQALEILGTALLQNRNNMAYTMLSSTEMIVRCKEDNWRILMTEEIIKELQLLMAWTETIECQQIHAETFRLRCS